MDGRDLPDRRIHKRVDLGGGAMLISAIGEVPVLESGDLIDISRGGCQIRLQRRVDPRRTAQVRLALAGDMVWFPVTTSWVRQDADGWIIGCLFEPLAPAMQDVLRNVMSELSLS